MIRDASVIYRLMRWVSVAALVTAAIMGHCAASAMTYYNNVYVTSATTGTGTLTLGAAVTSGSYTYATFAGAGVPNGTQVRYVIYDGSIGFESGLGTYTSSGTTLTRCDNSSCTPLSLDGAEKIALTPVAADWNVVAFTSRNQGWTAAQRGMPTNIVISTATFTPNFDTAQNFEIDLTSACPCTLANPSTTLVAGQSGMIEVHQDATGSRTIGTWGSDYQSAGGTATITLSTAASAVDYLPYYVDNAATGIVLGAILKAPVH